MSRGFAMDNEQRTYILFTEQYFMAVLDSYDYIVFVFILVEYLRHRHCDGSRSCIASVTLDDNYRTSSNIYE